MNPGVWVGNQSSAPTISQRKKTWGGHASTPNLIQANPHPHPTPLVSLLLALPPLPPPAQSHIWFPSRLTLKCSLIKIFRKPRPGVHRSKPLPRRPLGPELLWPADVSHADISHLIFIKHLLYQKPSTGHPPIPVPTPKSSPCSTHFADE